MKLPYQIIREPYDQGWQHILVRELGHGIEEVIDAHIWASPFAPHWMARKQATLNTAHVLDQSKIM